MVLFVIQGRYDMNKSITSISSKMQCALVPFFYDQLSYEAVQDVLATHGNRVDLTDDKERMEMAVLMSEQAPDHIFDYLDDVFPDIYIGVTK